jgi:ribosomal protein S27AE
MRRAQERALEKLAIQREKLARLEAGGSHENPVVLESASQVEVHAGSLRCPRCDAPCRVAEHLAETIDGARLRVAKLVCGSCGTGRSVYFRISPRASN